jgi:hypothetical protein
VGEQSALVDYYRQAAVGAERFQQEYCGTGALHVDASERVRALVEQFTILAHKQLAYGGAQGDVTPGEAVGSVTLF